jgi:hypothetical protein
MITAIVQFSLPKPISLEEAARAFEQPRRNIRGCEGSYANTICAVRTGRRAGGVLSVGDARRRRSRLQR